MNPEPGTRKPELDRVRADLEAAAEPERVAGLQRFFKTGPGEYGEGDVFRGIRVPVLRKLARKHRGLPLEDAQALLTSTYHEDRLLALLLLVDAYRRGDATTQQAIYDLYLAHTAYVNNWDLVDTSAEHIVGAYLKGRDRGRLDDLARSRSVWERRMAVMATFHYVKHGAFADTLRLAERLLDDPHNLIHKAVGWMLREIGKRDRAAAERFLQAHLLRMPRTMLRYAIERFPEPLRQAYLHAV